MKKSLLSLVATAAIFVASNSYAVDSTNEVVVVDFQKVFMESAAGKDLNNKLEAQKKSFEDSRNKKESELIKINEDLKKQQSVLSGEAFEKKRKDFEVKVQNFQQDLQADGMKFEKMKNNALEQIEEATKKVISDIAADKKFKLVVSKNAVLFNSDDLDVSTEVLKKLDSKLKSVDLK
jgi:outer membrane protein